MTKNEVIDIVHKTILGFLDVVADDSEEPISEKDKLLLEVNKAVCNAIKDMPDDERKTGNRKVCKDCKHFKGGKCGERGGTIGRCKLRDVIGTHRGGSVTACRLYEKGAGE